ncbi:hypothetical protein [Commensalibacter melissae]|nr:hypothetical protein [Commensalibacter melissae]MUG77233.1 hypothetical protein [Commensalibacter melissae]
MENRKGLNQRYKGVDRQWSVNRNSGNIQLWGSKFDGKDTPQCPNTRK